MKQQLVIIGNGMATGRFLQALDKLPHSCEITIISKEPHGSYNRILLSSVLAGEKQPDEIVTLDTQWYRDRGIRLFLGVAVSSIDTTLKSLALDNGQIIHWDKLIVATGSSPSRPDLPGIAGNGVISFRDFSDTDEMLRFADSHNPKAIVIGGGLLGLEAAWGLRKQGVHVTVIHRSSTLMNRQLDQEAGTMLTSILENAGVTVKTGAHISEITLDDTYHVRGVTLENGDFIEGGMVVMAIGITPNTQIGAEAGLEVQRGIVVNNHLQTSHPDIFAIGECCEFSGKTYGLVAPVFRQAEILAHELADDTTDSTDYQNEPTATQLKITGTSIFSAGRFQQMDIFRGNTLIFRDHTRGIYKKLFIEDDHLVGAVLVGEIDEGPWYFDLIKDKKPITAFQEHLVFGKAFIDEAA